MVTIYHSSSNGGGGGGVPSVGLRLYGFVRLLLNLVLTFLPALSTSIVETVSLFDLTLSGVQVRLGVWGICLDNECHYYGFGNSQIESQTSSVTGFLRGLHVTVAILGAVLFSTYIYLLTSIRRSHPKIKQIQPALISLDIITSAMIALTVVYDVITYQNITGSGAVVTSMDRTGFGIGFAFVGLAFVVCFVDAMGMRVVEFLGFARVK